jgi:predicted Zn-ribbon and HTH transcriptional regulator
MTPMISSDCAEPKAVSVDGICTCPYCQREFHVSEGTARRRVTCNRCGFTWNSRTGSPRKCPRCGSYAWNSPTQKCECRQCHHVWNPRKSVQPQRCPNCKSKLWNNAFVTEQRKSAVGRFEAGVIADYRSGEGCLAIAEKRGMALFSVMNVIKRYSGSSVMPRL